MSLRKRLLVKPPSTGITPSEHFGVVLYEGDGSSSHSINGGKFGAGAYFGGSAYISTSLPNITGNPVFSISFWVNPTSTGTPIMLGNASNGAAFVTFINPSNKLNFGRYGDSLGDSTASIPNNTWTHIAISNNAGNVQLYINGTADLSFSTTYNIGSNNVYLFTAVTGQVLQGKLDQFRFFQKALSSSEVSTLYAETVETVESLDPLSEDTTDTLQVLGDSSCVATYRFENDETDLSGNYDGTGTAIQYAAGRYGQSAYFNGTDSYVSTGINLSNLSAYSYSVWFKQTSSTSNPRIFGGVNGTKTNTGMFRVRTDTNEFNYYSINNTTYNWSQGLTDNAWSYLTLTDDGTNVKLYVNGSEVTSPSTVSYTTDSNTNLQIGRGMLNSGTIGNYMEGYIDQVRIFNKALSASEVTTLYQENSLVASYRFEGNANDDMRAYDGTATNVTYEYGLNFTPDFVWVKYRDSSSNSHRITDSTRGAQYEIYPNLTNAEIYRASGYMSSFDQGGFTVGSTTALNADGGDYVAWCLKANGGTTSSNTDGSITSTVQANTDAGFSIVKYTGTGTSGATVGHGLSAKPELIITKNLIDSVDWNVKEFSTMTDDKDRLELNESFAIFTASSGTFILSTTNSTTIGLGSSSRTNGSGDEMIAYCFHSVDGFSKIGSYTGNGSANGPIIETGFEPAFIMVKRTSNVSDWSIFDNKRNLTNPRDLVLAPNIIDAERTYGPVTFLSNGFQQTNTKGGLNSNGDTFIYMAFAADPDTEAPTVAKSFSTVAYTGNGSTQSIDGLGFQPNLVWTKDRVNSGGWHFLADSTRGGTKIISSNSSDAEQTRSNHIQSFDSDGFTLGPDGTSNYAGESYVAWAWKADDNEPTINTEGSIDSLVSANANAGFSIIKWTAPSSGDYSVGHGLSSTPDLVIIKPTTAAVGWLVWHENQTNLTRSYLRLHTSDAEATAGTSVWGTGMTSTTIGLNVNATSGANVGMIAYCFHSVSNYSKIGSYTGTGTTNSITGLGFQADWIMIKRTDAANDWTIFDSVRDGYTDNDKVLWADLSDAEATGGGPTNIDLTSDGFAFDSGVNGSSINANGGTYIYMAFKIN